MPLVLTNGTTVTIVQPNTATVKVVGPTPVQVGVVAVPAGASFGSEAYEFVQSVPSASWDIPLPGSFPARRPGVTLYDTSGNEIESDVFWNSATKHISVVFPSPTSGVAVIT